MLNRLSVTFRNTSLSAALIIHRNVLVFLPPVNQSVTEITAENHIIGLRRCGQIALRCHCSG